MDGPVEDGLREVLSALARPQARATHAMPGAFYTSEAFAAIEREKVFRSVWACIGHVGEIPAPGDYYTTELVGEPLLVQRDAQGQVRVLANVCRHRGNLVATRSGNRQIHACAYHAWSYELDGRLRRAPLMQDCKELDVASCRLPQIPMDAK